MLTKPQPPRIHLSMGWQDCVMSTGLHSITLAQYAIVYARARAADSINARVPLVAENDRLLEYQERLHAQDLRARAVKKLIRV
jgi:hypothetical protein